MKTALLQKALSKGGHDAAHGGARRERGKIPRPKDRVYSFRNQHHQSDPKNQRPEPWNLYNGKVNPGESIRVFPLSNWTELDVWQYIYLENIPIVPLYFAARRPVGDRDGVLIMVDDSPMALKSAKSPWRSWSAFRTLCSYPLTGEPWKSSATTLPFWKIIEEMLLAEEFRTPGPHDRLRRSGQHGTEKAGRGYF